MEKIRAWKERPQSQNKNKEMPFEWRTGDAFNRVSLKTPSLIFLKSLHLLPSYFWHY